MKTREVDEFKKYDYEASLYSLLDKTNIVDDFLSDLTNFQIAKSAANNPMQQTPKSSILQVNNIYDYDGETHLSSIVKSFKIDGDISQTTGHNHDVVVEELDDLSNIGIDRAGAGEVEDVDVTFESPNRMQKTSKPIEPKLSRQEMEANLQHELAQMGKPKTTEVEGETLIEFAYYIQIVMLQIKWFALDFQKQKDMLS